MSFPNHYETARTLAQSPEAVFAVLDDHARLSAHMMQSSWMMAGSSMKLEFDAAKGRAVGAVISMSGRVFGVRLFVSERVIEYFPPHNKVWQTLDTPRLLVIGHYRMGFDIQALRTGSRVCVFIDYALPGSFMGRVLGELLGHWYARWCTERMADTVLVTRPPAC